jgi:hypothetical protein
LEEEWDHVLNIQIIRILIPRVLTKLFRKIGWANRVGEVEHEEHVLGNKVDADVHDHSYQKIRFTSANQEFHYEYQIY